MDRLTKRELCKLIASRYPALVCRWIPETAEYRVALRGLPGIGNEASAYYTNDQRDALLMADAMASQSERR